MYIKRDARLARSKLILLFGFHGRVERKKNHLSRFDLRYRKPMQDTYRCLKYLLSVSQPARGALEDRGNACMKNIIEKS